MKRYKKQIKTMIIFYPADPAARNDCSVRWCQLFRNN